jgi:hypothetical protein
MINKHTAFFHHFLKMAVAQRISRVPTDANQNDVDRKAHSFGSQHLVSNLFSQNAQHSHTPSLPANATEPKKAVQMEYAMTDKGTLKLECRQALLFYALRRLRLESIEDLNKPREYQIVLVNREELQPFVDELQF